MHYTLLHDLQGITGWHVLLHAKPFYIDLHAFTCIYKRLHEKTSITCSRQGPWDFKMVGPQLCCLKPGSGVHPAESTGPWISWALLGLILQVLVPSERSSG